MLRAVKDYEIGIVRMLLSSSSIPENAHIEALFRATSQDNLEIMKILLAKSGISEEACGLY